MNIMKLVKESQVFAGLSTEEVQKVLSIAAESLYKKGDVIFHEHSFGEELVVLLEGKVSIKLMVVSDKEHMPIYIVQPGEVFGELSVIDSGPRSATAVCEEDAVVKVIKKRELDALIEKDSRLGMLIYRNIAKIVCERIRRTNEKLINNITWGII